MAWDTLMRVNVDTPCEVCVRVFECRMLPNHFRVELADQYVETGMRSRTAVEQVQTNVHGRQCCKQQKLATCLGYWTGTHKIFKLCPDLPCKFCLACSSCLQGLWIVQCPNAWACAECAMHNTVLLRLQAERYSTAGWQMPTQTTSSLAICQKD